MRARRTPIKPTQNCTKRQFAARGAGRGAAPLVAAAGPNRAMVESFWRTAGLGMIEAGVPARPRTSWLQMRVSRSSFRLLAGLAIVAACGSEGPSNGPPLDPSHTDGTTFVTVGTDSSTSSSTSGSGSGTADSSTTWVGPSNCGELECTGHSACEIGDGGHPVCVCDPGYVRSDDPSVCVVDERCVQIRFLEDHCRQVANGPPAVSLFFAVDFCAGTAVTPERREQLGLEFQVLENGVDIEENVESVSAIIDKPVESYVTLVLDVSDSVTESQDLQALVDELRTFVGTLGPGVNEPDVYVSIYVFGRDVAEYVPFTRDLLQVDAALQAIADDPEPIVLLAGNGDGTDLYDAVELGIHRTQRIRELRDAVTWGGVLTTGTVVVVTDGKDTSNGALDQGLIDGTTNNVVSIGLSDEIEAEDLQAIGRDASFLAPTPEDWAMAFAEITQRVDEYPLRSYLLAYCSSASEGQPQVEITIEGIGVTVTTSAVCEFDADVFSSDPLDVCGLELFENECETQACGGLTACGACSDDACCDGSACVAPVDSDAAGLPCEDQPELCIFGEVCDPTQSLGSGLGQCVPPQAPGAGCLPGCDPGVTYCSDAEEPESGICLGVLAPGDDCELAEQCPDRNCSRVKEDNPLEHRVCRGPALLFDFCGNDEAVCEIGGACSGGICAPKEHPNEQCSDGGDCRSGVCEMVGDAGNRCNGGGACFWAWNEKVPS